MVVMVVFQVFQYQHLLRILNSKQIWSNNSKQQSVATLFCCDQPQPHSINCYKVFSAQLGTFKNIQSTREVAAASLVGLVMLMTAMKPNHVNNYFDDGDARFISEMQLFPLEPRKCLKASPAVTLESLSTNWMSEFNLLMLMCLDVTTLPPTNHPDFDPAKKAACQD